MLIRVRRGLEANRLSYTPQSGEPTYTTDTKKLYIGDGVTPGGILVDLSGGGIVQTIVAGENITVDATDPTNPIVSATPGGGGAVDSVNGQTGEVVLDADDISDAATTNKFATAAEKTKLGYIAVTQAVDLDAMESKLAGIESGADVTDTANVTAAGALMDSEVTNLAAVKAFDPTDYATAAQGAEADTAVQPGDLATVATSGDYDDLSNKPTIPTVPTSIDDLNPSQTGNSGKFLTTDGSNASWASIPGGGDMLASVYDPTSVAGDAFDQDNMADGTTNKNFTATEKTKLSGIEENADVTDATNVASAGATMDTDTSLVGNGYFLDEDNMASDSASKVASQQSIKAYVDAAITAAKAAMLPVGSIVHLNVSTNPNTLYGFGTWARIEGRFIVGVSDSDTDFDLNDTGGAKTVTLTSAQSGVPAHGHGITDPGHTHNTGKANLLDSGNGTILRREDNSTGGATPVSSATTGISVDNNTPADAASAHENLPPYIAKYIWQRTA